MHNPLSLYGEMVENSPFSSTFFSYPLASTYKRMTRKKPSVDIGWKPDKESRHHYSIAICQEVPWCWHGYWKCWFSSDSFPEPQRKRLVLSRHIMGVSFWLILVFWWECGGCWLQSPLAATVAECSCPTFSLGHHCVTTDYSTMCLLGCSGKEGISGGCSPYCCLSQNMALWRFCSFSIPHRWGV